VIRRFDRSRDGVRNVVKLQIEPDFCTGGQNRAHNFRSFGGVKLEADLEKGDFPAELLNEFEGLFLGRDVECDDDFVGCHGNIGMWPGCPAEIFSAAFSSAGYKPAGRTD